MAESQTIARPYADAAFQFASNANDLAGWSSALERLAAVTGTDEARTLISSPQIDADALAATMSDAARDLNAQQRNFVTLLARNRRLAVVPEIRSLYEAQRSSHEGSVDATVESAFPLTEAQVADIVQTLSARFGKKVQVTTTVNPDLIGGVSIRMGDEVIDTSVRGKLAQLATSLKS